MASTAPQTPSQKWTRMELAAWTITSVILFLGLTIYQGVTQATLDRDALFGTFEILGIDISVFWKIAFAGTIISLLLYRLLGVTPISWLLSPPQSRTINQENVFGGDIVTNLRVLAQRYESHRSSARFHIAALIVSFASGVTSLVYLEINASVVDQRANKTISQLTSLAETIRTIATPSLPEPKRVKPEWTRPEYAVIRWAMDVCSAARTATLLKNYEKAQNIEPCAKLYENFESQPLAKRLSQSYSEPVSFFQRVDRSVQTIEAAESLFTQLNQTIQAKALLDAIDAIRRDVVVAYRSEELNINIIMQRLLSRLAIVGLTFAAIYLFGSLYRYNMAMAAKYAAVGDAIVLKSTGEQLTSKGIEEVIAAVSASQDDLFKGKQLMEHFTEIFGKVIDRLGSSGSKTG
jgi:hypothetical protein